MNNNYREFINDFDIVKIKLENKMDDENNFLLKTHNIQF